MRNLLAALVLLLTAASAQAAPKLAGKWRAVKIEKGGERRTMPPGLTLLLNFKKSGEFITRMTVRSKSKVERGIWKIKGSVLHTTVAGKSESMKFHIAGKKLRLDNEARKTVLFLVRP